MRKLIIGLGSGRCGTTTLARILNAQENALFTHENFTLPWRVNECMGLGAVVSMHGRDANMFGDSAFYWIKYVPEVLRYAPDARFVCLKRNKNEVVRSFLARSDKQNWWTDPSSKHWDTELKLEFKIIMFPKYDLPKTDGVSEYYDEYYRKAVAWEKIYPRNFKIFNMEEVLNEEVAQIKMFDFCGIENPKLMLGKKYNQAVNPTIEFTKIDNIDHNPNSCGVCGKIASYRADCAGWSVFVFGCNDCKNKVTERLKKSIRGATWR